MLINTPSTLPTSQHQGCLSYQEMPAIVSSNINNKCKIIINNCTPYDVMIDRKNVIGIMDIESGTLIPMTQRYHQFYLTKNTLPKVSKKKSTKGQNCTKSAPEHSHRNTNFFIDTLFKYKDALSAKNMISDWQKVTNTIYT
jgi:hypothetical protein